MLDKEQYPVLVLAYHHRKGCVERLAEAGSEVLLLCSVGVDIGLEQQCAECRAKRKGVDGRDTYRHSHGQTELCVERTRCATHERNGDKYRHEHQRGGDNRVADALHGIDTRHIGRMVAHVEPRLYRLERISGFRLMLM